MLKITVEIYPFGEENEKRTLGTMRIANETTGTPELGNYRFIYLDDTGQYTGTVDGFPRRLGFWRLIYQCLAKQEIKERVLSQAVKAELDDHMTEKL